MSRYWGGVLTFDEVVAASAAPKKFEQLIACYNAARSEDDVALQSALPMRLFAPLMANITLMERVSHDLMIYRIAGENIIARLGYNPTGNNFFELLPTSRREATKQMYQHILQHPCGHYTVYENEYRSGRRMMSESLMLPIRKDENSKATFVLGYHAHHQGTDVFRPEGKTTLAVAIKTSELVDIGSSVPALDDGTGFSVGIRQAESV